LGAVAVAVVFGAAMYLIGALRPWNAAPERSTNSALPLASASVAPVLAPTVSQAPPAAAAVASQAPVVEPVTAPSVTVHPSAVRVPNRPVVKPAAPAASASASAAPPVTPAVLAPSDPFDQRR
jgi:hypothetical protein